MTTNNLISHDNLQVKMVNEVIGIMSKFSLNKRKINDVTQTVMSTQKINEIMNIKPDVN